MNNLNVSSGEFACMKALEAMKIDYVREVCVIQNNDGKWLRMDFEIKREDRTLYIEYDGQQHFKTRCFGGISQSDAQTAFEKTQLHDQIKNQWCIDNGHPLLRIPYTEFGNVSQKITEFITMHTSWDGTE